MIHLHPDFIVDEKAKRKAVVLPYTEWEMLLAEIEELNDIRAYDAAKAEDDEIIPFDQAVKEIKEGKIP